MKRNLLAFLLLASTAFGQVPSPFKTTATIITPVTSGHALRMPSGDLRVRSSGSAYDLKIGSTEVLTADRFLYLLLGNANRILSMSGDLTTADAFTTSGAFPLTLTQTASTNVTLPTSGTLYGTATGSITSANLSGSLSDETGTGSLVFSASPTFTGTINGAAGTFSGNLQAAALGVGTPPLASRILRLLGSTSGDTTQIGAAVQVTADSSATASARGMYSQVTTAAGSYNTATISSIWAQRATIGAGATATDVIGFHSDIQTGGSGINACFRGANAAAAKVWNLYMSGTAANYLNGNLLIGTTTVPSGATYNHVLGGGSTSPVLGAATADMVSQAAVDAAAGDRQLYARTEAGQANRLTGLSCRVATDFSKTSDTTLANITGLTRNVRAGESYAIRSVLFTTSNVAGGVKAAIGGTATATSIIAEADVKDGSTLATVGTTRVAALATAMGDVTAVTAARVTIEGHIVVNAAGTLTVQFAQNASNGTASTVKAGSYFELISIGN